MILNKPDYYDSFCCLAGHCPDSCCKEWDVQVDRESAQSYRKLPGELGDRLRQVLRDEDGESLMCIENGRCPMWRSDGLCRIQAELGEEALCVTCRSFPRISHEYDSFTELGLELSCPEAARLILAAEPRNIVSALPSDCPEDLRRLVQFREELRGILRDERYTLAQRLAVALMHAYYAEEQFNFDDEEVFDCQAELARAESFAGEGDIVGFMAFFQSLEILSPDWAQALESPKADIWRQEHVRLAEYFLDRYYLQSISDGDIAARVKLMIISCLAVKLIGGETVKTAQRYSKEIENNIDNIEAVLEGAYTCPAFTDEKLLAMLLNGDVIK